MGEYPAIDLIWRVVPDDAHVERLLAEIDDEHPTAVEPRDGGVRVFFPTAAARDRAAPLLCSHDSSLTCTPLSVPDEDWAARSQASLGSVRVGRIVVTPPHAITPGWDDGAIGIVIQPSMGFGTGHHATTRRCLELMQQIDLRRASVLDVGTGSGILAIAGAKLGATRVIGVDHDPDALTAAAENVERNAVDVTLENIDLSESPLPEAFDLVVANLTGATLERFAAQLTSALTSTGHLIVSGLMATEEDGVRTALESRGLRVVAKAHEEEWVALQLRRRSI